MYSTVFTENQLDTWVRGNSRDAQEVIVETIYRLVAASSPQPNERRFPLGDSIGQHGPDGFLNTDYPFLPFVPIGKSYWEVGTGDYPGRKATADYTSLTNDTPESVRKESVFIFVTPLSGTGDWPHTWKEGQQAAWLKERRELGEWREVHIIDGTRLIDWLRVFPSPANWLAEKMGLPVTELVTPEYCWNELQSIGEPPPLIPDIFLTNRDTARKRVEEVFKGDVRQLRLDTRFPDQMVDFVVAHISSMPMEEYLDTIGRCLVISGEAGWNAACSLQTPHVLVADFDLDSTSGTKLLERARRAGHAVIYSGMPGGFPQPYRATIAETGERHIQEALIKSGYDPERARMLAIRSAGNLSSLLRCLHNLSAMPEWSQATDAANLAVAEILGGWNDASGADRGVAEFVSGNSYGEWIGKMRDIALQPDTPLTYRDGIWKFALRYEGWHALGPRLFDEHLDRFKEVAIRVLGEIDPQFDLSPDDRFMASVREKKLTHSEQLRSGLAETLALLGTYPKALASCSHGKAELTVALTVRNILAHDEWQVWASIDRLLPLIAEAAPSEFLDAVERLLVNAPNLFDALFAQERSGITGRNHMTGLLWGLETLAWEANHLPRVILVLGELAARDPGGNWGNRPSNSLVTILLPWMPQTRASISQRRAAVITLLKESPDVAWQLLISLLPSTHQTSMGSHKPMWRNTDDGSSYHATRVEYLEQIENYSSLAVEVAKQDTAKLLSLIDRIENLPSGARQSLIAHFASTAVLSLQADERLKIWTELTNLVAKHRKFADAVWAMNEEIVNEISLVADALAPDNPSLLYRRLFSERDWELFEEVGNYEQQQKLINDRRIEAISNIFSMGGFQSVMEFASTVDSPWRVGASFSQIDGNSQERIIPAFIDSDDRSKVQFAAGFATAKFQKGGWQWFDTINMDAWSLSEKANILSYMPFDKQTWLRAAQQLGKEERMYWLATAVNPFAAGSNDLGVAIDRLVEVGRMREAIHCLERLAHDGNNIDASQAIRVLEAVMVSPDTTVKDLDIHAAVDVIKALQDDAELPHDALIQIEWWFLPFLDKYSGAYPKQLERRLATNPEFFCELIRIIFFSKKEERPAEPPSQERQNIAKNAYRLLSQWRTPPGTLDNGTYSGEALKEWISSVKSECANSGHLEVALTMVGHVLTYVPADPENLWIHRAAADVLDTKDADKARNGFTTQLVNSRGAYFVTGGQEERMLAEGYHTQAEQLELNGYHRFASSMRRLAESYILEAEREEREGSDY